MKSLRVILSVIIFAAVLNICAYPCHSASYKKNFYRELSRRLTSNRDDYKFLSDKEFANFRMINTTGISKGRLYRSSSPVNSWGKRNTIADSLSMTAGIKSFINLADSQQDISRYKNFSHTYYSTQAFIGLNTGLRFQSREFQNRLAQGIKFMANHEAPFLIHCDLGKDRAGLFCAVVESLAGASAEEITADYMISFYNYFNIKPNTPEYEFIANNEIRPFLAAMLGVKNIHSVNLQRAAENYLQKIGVTIQDITALRNKLAQ